MTLPDERYRSVIQTEQFLKDLLDPSKTPRVSKEIRRQAAACLRHYPSKYHMDIVGTLVKDVFESRDKIDRLSMMVFDYQQHKEKTDD